MNDKRNSVNVIKFQSPFERLKIYNVSPEIALRKAIITQAIIDASNISEMKSARKLEKEAKLWIFGGNEFFKETCIECGLEPSFVAKTAKAVIKLHKMQSLVRDPITKIYKKPLRKKHQH